MLNTCFSKAQIILNTETGGEKGNLNVEKCTEVVKAEKKDHLPAGAVGSEAG